MYVQSTNKREIQCDQTKYTLDFKKIYLGLIYNLKRNLRESKFQVQQREPKKQD